MTIEYGTPISATKIVFGYGQMFQGIGIGAGAALLAALYPSLRAVTIQPIDAMKRIRRGYRRRPAQKTYGLAFGLLLLVYLAVSSFSGWASQTRTFEILDPMAAMAGVVLVAPFAVLGLVRVFKLAIGMAADQRRRGTARA